MSLMQSFIQTEMSSSHPFQQCKVSLVGGMVVLWIFWAEFLQIGLLLFILLWQVSVFIFDDIFSYYALFV